MAALTPETESSRLARYKRAAAEESDSDSDDEVSASFFASQIQIEKTKSEARARTLSALYFIWSTVKAKAQDISKALATYRELYVVQKGQLKRQQVLAKAMSAGACLDELEAIIAPRPRLFALPRRPPRASAALPRGWPPGGGAPLASHQPSRLHGQCLRPHLGIIENAPGAEGPLSRRFGDWGLWLCGRANPLMRERAGLLMLRISPIYHTCPAV